jgi:hypothetical protein
VPLQKLKLAPGVKRDNTTLAGEGGWFECDKIRFRSGTVEKMGGWKVDPGQAQAALKPTTGSFWGIARFLWGWVTLRGMNLLGTGTNSKMYIQAGTGGSFYDITPIRYTTLTGGVTFSATSGSSTITATCASHGAKAGAFVTISGAASLGGNITAAILSAEHRIISVGVNTFTFEVSATANASDSGSGGAASVAAFQINPGPDISYSEVGWGAGTWGAGSWGFTSSPEISAEAQLWSGSNYGQDFIFNPRYGGIYYWAADPSDSYNFQRAKRLTQQTFTVTIATPGVITLENTLAENTTFIPSTNGTLPTGMTAGTTYYLVNVSGTTANFASSYGGSPITTTGTQSGTHQLVVADCPTVSTLVEVSDASRFILAFGCNDYGESTKDPMLIRWSDQENYNVWTPEVTNQAGSYRLSHGSEIKTAIQARQEFLVWTDSALYSMQYLGPPYVWGFNILADNISLAGPNVVAQANGIAYWMGVDKFYAYAGRVEPLPCTLRQYVFNNINLGQGYQFFAGTNEGFNEIWWFYCSAGSTTVDRYVTYNYLEQAWAYGTMARTAWLDSPLRDYPTAAGYNGQLLYHENGVDDGTTTPASPIHAYVQSSDFDLGDGDSYMFVDKMIPDVNFDGSESVAPEVTMQLLPRQNPGSGYNTAASPDVISANSYASTRTHTVQRFTDIIYVRGRGRQMAFKIESNSVGTQWQLGVPRLSIRPDGRRA